MEGSDGADPVDTQSLVHSMGESLWKSFDDDVRVEDTPAEVLEGVNKLSDARKLRKQAELDVQALENRILLLEKEEERARQRIELTKKRADEIVSMREHNLKKKKAIQHLARKAKEPEFLRSKLRSKHKQKHKDKKKLKKGGERVLSSRDSKKTTRKDIEENKRREATKFREERKKQFDAVSKRRRQDQKAAKKKMLAIKKTAGRGP